MLWLHGPNPRVVSRGPHQPCGEIIVMDVDLSKWSLASHRPASKLRLLNMASRNTGPIDSHGLASPQIIPSSSVGYTGEITFFSINSYLHIFLWIPHQSRVHSMNKLRRSWKEMQSWVIFIIPLSFNATGMRDGNWSKNWDVMPYYVQPMKELCPLLPHYEIVLQKLFSISAVKSYWDRMQDFPSSRAYIPIPTVAMFIRRTTSRHRKRRGK